MNEEAVMYCGILVIAGLFAYCYWIDRAATIERTAEEVRLKGIAEEEAKWRLRVSEYDADTRLLDEAIGEFRRYDA
jgi:hypothetical protein